MIKLRIKDLFLELVELAFSTYIPTLNLGSLDRIGVSDGRIGEDIIGFIYKNTYLCT